MYSLSSAKDVRYEALPPVGIHSPTISRDNASALLTSVLEGMQTQVSQIGSLGVLPHSNHTTFFSKTIHRRGGCPSDPLRTRVEANAAREPAFPGSA